MSRSSTLEIVSNAAKLVAAIGDVPALSVLKPIGSIGFTICEHVAALKDNKEAAINVAERVNRTVRVLINCGTRDLNGAMPGNYIDDIEDLEKVLVKIADTLQAFRRRNWIQRLGSTKADAALLTGLSSELDDAIRMFGLSADIEGRKAFRTIQARLPKEVPELFHPTINLGALRVHSELDATNNYSVQVGTYDNHAVVVKKYYPLQEERFAQDLGQRQILLHPAIACIIGSFGRASIMLLCAEDLIFCSNNLVDINSVRRPWQDRRIGPQVSSVKMRFEGSHSTSTIQDLSNQHPLPDAENIWDTDVETLIIKESGALLHQLTSVVQFLQNMKVEIAWWEFKPSWVGLQGKKQLILIDWDQDTKSAKGGEFEPQYAIHVIGLGFSDIVPEAFQDSGRLLKEDSAEPPHQSPAPTYIAGTARYECPYCQRRFIRPSSLKIHVAIHTGEKPFQCPFPGCGRRFSVMSNMRRHTRIHTQTRPADEVVPDAEGKPDTASETLKVALG